MWPRSVGVTGSESTCLTWCAARSATAGARRGGPPHLVWQAGTVHRFRRQDSLRRLADERFDVLVVGGGVTGAGVALVLTGAGFYGLRVDYLGLLIGLK